GRGCGRLLVEDRPQQQRALEVAEGALCLLQLLVADRDVLGGEARLGRGEQILAMQKVVGSSPIIRFKHPRKSGGFGKRSGVLGGQASAGMGSPRILAVRTSAGWARSERRCRRQVTDAESSRSIVRSPGSDWLPSECLR